MTTPANTNLALFPKRNDWRSRWSTMSSSRLAALDEAIAAARRPGTPVEERWTVFNRVVHVWGRVQGLDQAIQRNAPDLHAELANEIAAAGERLKGLAIEVARSIMTDKAESAALFRHLLRSGRLPELEAAAGGAPVVPDPIAPGEIPAGERG